MPLFQTSFLPLLMHVNVLPFEFLVIPSLAQLAPVLGGVAAMAGSMEITSKLDSKIAIRRMLSNTT
jgi:hypothetical protein